MLLSQSFLFTLNGSVYLGARLGLPSLSSRMKTNSAVCRGFAMKGEYLNLLRSSAQGEKAAAFDLASSSCSVAEGRRGCSSWKHSPGMQRGVPKTISAAEVAVSSLGALRRPSMAQGRDRVHDLLARTAQCRAFS